MNDNDKNSLFVAKSIAKTGLCVKARLGLAAGYEPMVMREELHIQSY